MRISNKFRNTKGFISSWQDVIRWRDMITTQAKRRYEILVFWDKHGLPATLDAFKVKKRTLFNWKKKLTQGIGRLIKDLGGLRRFPQKIRHNGKVVPVKRQKVIRKPKDFEALFPGHCVALDTFEEIRNGMRRYVITFEDIFTRFGFALATRSHASLAAAEFFKLCIQVFPYPITFVLTDNGSEFKKNFAAELCRLHLIHYHTYPRTPKMNAHAERFNRTVQESFSNFHKDILFTHVEKFNQLLAGWLLFYNLKRVHYAFHNKQSPIQFMLSLPLQTLTAECKRGWPHTPP